jgi:protocatechuate 3,4-dioxygenase beta subunit
LIGDTMNHLDDDHPEHQGLARDLPLLLAQRGSRRQALNWLGVALGGTGLGLMGCGGGSANDATATATGTTTSTGGSTGSTTTTDTSTTSTGSTGSVSSCSVVAEETAGPYPGDGSNTANGSVANALALSGIVRSDIRTSVGSASGTAAGVPTQVIIRLVNVNNSCADLSGYAIYLWHCDALGRYSLYSSGVTGENYLRGVQATDSSGQATFQTIYPGCYSGRMPHMHFEVYRSSTTATSYSNKLKTSQLAFPNDVSSTVYTSSTYTGSASNLAKMSFATDNVFSDGTSTELTTLTGNLTDGYTATLTVGMSV